MGHCEWAKLAWNVECKVQKIVNKKTFPFGFVLDIKKWFKICKGKHLFELLIDAMKCVIIEDRLQMEALFEYYLHCKCWAQHKDKMS